MRLMATGSHQAYMNVCLLACLPACLSVCSGTNQTTGFIWAEGDWVRKSWNCSAVDGSIIFLSSFHLILSFCGQNRLSLDSYCLCNLCIKYNTKMLIYTNINTHIFTNRSQESNYYIKAAIIKQCSDTPNDQRPVTENTAVKMTVLDKIFFFF